jgi:hypothetical protein
MIALDAPSSARVSWQSVEKGPYYGCAGFASRRELFNGLLDLK